MIRSTISALFLLLGIAGCACCPRAQQRVASLPQSHVIFAPRPVLLAGESFGRDDWPVAYDGYDSGTYTEFREVITDYQGLFDHHHDHYYRRFDSVRSGVQRR